MTVPDSVSGVFGSSSTAESTALNCCQVIEALKAVRSILSPSVVLKSVIVSSPLSASNANVLAPAPPVSVSSVDSTE